MNNHVKFYTRFSFQYKIEMSFYTISLQKGELLRFQLHIEFQNSDPNASILDQLGYLGILWPQNVCSMEIPFKRV